MHFVDNLEETYRNIVEAASLSDSKLLEMKKHYDAITNLLKNDSQFWGKYSGLIEIYEQGSVSLGTTIRPLDDDFDLDLVLQLNACYEGYSAKSLLDELVRVFRNSPTYKDKLEVKNRCVRINYAGDFHMDILPAMKRDNNSQSTAIMVPDRELKDWTPSNPKGFTNWFLTRAKRVQLTEDYQASLNTTELLDEKPLKDTVKLLKIYRDEYYVGKKEDYKVPSIILTTLAGMAYRRSSTITGTLDGFLSYLNSRLDEDKILIIPNPVDSNESFSERWESDEEIYNKFLSFKDDLISKVNKIKDEKNSFLRETLIKSFVSPEKYSNGLEYFSQKPRKEAILKKNYSGLMELANPKTEYHRPYGEL